MLTPEPSICSTQQPQTRLGLAPQLWCLLGLLHCQQLRWKLPLHLPMHLSLHLADCLRLGLCSQLAEQLGLQLSRQLAWQLAGHLGRQLVAKLAEQLRWRLLTARSGLLLAPQHAMHVLW